MNALSVSSCQALGKFPGIQCSYSDPMPHVPVRLSPGELQCHLAVLIISFPKLWLPHAGRMTGVWGACEKCRFLDFYEDSYV